MKQTELEERAGRRGGILTCADLDAAGLSAGGIGLAVAAGRIVRVRLAGAQESGKPATHLLCAMAWPYLEAGDLFVEKRREDWIREQGFGFLRTTWSETLQEPSELCRRVFRPLLAVAA